VIRQISRRVIWHIAVNFMMLTRLRESDSPCLIGLVNESHWSPFQPVSVTANQL
jgi:hypothetical protein